MGGEAVIKILPTVFVGKMKIHLRSTTKIRDL